MAISSNALVAKAKSMYGGRVTREDYLELCRKQDITQVVAFLKNQTRYELTLQGVMTKNAHREEIEDLLQREYYERLLSLLTYVPKSEQAFYIHVLKKIEVDIIADKMLHLLTNEPTTFMSEIPGDLAKRLSFNIYELPTVTTYQQFVTFMKDTQYSKILQATNVTTIELCNQVEVQCLQLYYDTYVHIIRKTYPGNTRKLLLEILYSEIELKNIEKIYRLTLFFKKEPTEIYQLLQKNYSHLSKQLVYKLCLAKNHNEFMQVLKLGKYDIYSHQKEYPFIEFYSETILYNIAKKYMRFSNDAPVVYLTYSVLLMTEIDNLKHIIESIRYNKNQTEIEKMIISL